MMMADEKKFQKGNSSLLRVVPKTNSGTQEDVYVRTKAKNRDLVSKLGK